jgi:hypothetical protein
MFSKIEQQQERQIQNATALSEYGEKGLAHSLIRCANEAGRELPIYRCQSRICEFCYWRVANRVCQKYVPRFVACAQQGFNIGSLTLTIPNLQEIRGIDFKHLATDWKAFLHQEPMRSGFTGALAKIETEYNSTYQEYHPHIHSLFTYRHCISHQVLKAAWGKLTCTPEEEIKLRDIPDTDAPARSVWINKIADSSSSPEDLWKAVQDAIDYMCKFQPISSPQAFVEYVLAVRGKHLVRAFGMARNRPKRAKPPLS